MPSFTLNASQGARFLSGEFDYLNESGSTIYYADSQGVGSGDTAVTVGNSLTRRAPSWVISAGQSNIIQSDPATITSSSAVPTGAVESQDIQAGAVTSAKLDTNISIAGTTATVGGITTGGATPTTAAKGVTFGTGTGPVTLYRSAADTLTTDDALVATGGVTSTGTLAATNAATVGTTLGVTGITTVTGGIGAAATKARALGIRSADWEVASTLSATGTDAAAADATTVYLVSVFVPVNCTVTGIATLNGTNVTTDKFVNYLFNAAGTKVGQTAAAGATPNADVFDEVDLTAPAAITGPAVYFIGRQHNGTTIGFQSITENKGHEPLAGSVAGTSFGAETAVVPPTTFTTAKGPFGYLY